MVRMAPHLCPGDCSPRARCDHQHGATPVSVLDARALCKLGEPGRGCRAAGCRRVHDENVLGFQSDRGPDVSGTELRSAALSTARRIEKRLLKKESLPDSGGFLFFLSEISALLLLEESESGVGQGGSKFVRYALARWPVDP